jgi:tetratricopeptide (TPR) repeat protein
MGLWQTVTYSDKVKEFYLSQSPQKSFFLMITLCLLIVGSIIGFYTLYQKYAGALSYSKGINTENLDEAITALNRAVNLDESKDVYFRVLSRVSLLKTNEILSNQELSQEQKQNVFQQGVANAEIAANKAIQINPQDSLNWQQLGSVYENLVSLKVKGAEQAAIQNYQKAQTLDPQNPQIVFFLGRTYFVMNNFSEAKRQLEKSLELKAGFSPATDLLKQIEEKKEK